MAIADLPLADTLARPLRDLRISVTDRCQFRDKACAGDCPAGCICEGERMLCIHPGDGAGCGACGPACPAGAIFCEDDVPGQWARFTAENAKFSGQPGSPGGAAK